MYIKFNWEFLYNLYFALFEKIHEVIGKILCRSIYEVYSLIKTQVIVIFQIDITLFDTRQLT